MLRKRIATAAVLLPLLVAATLYGKGQPHAWPFLLFTGIAVALCAHEFLRMFLPASRDILPGVLLALGVFLGGALLPCSLVLPAVLSCVLLAAFHVLPGPSEPAGKVRRGAMLVLVAIYVGGLLSMYPRVLFLPRGEIWVLLGILSVSVGDTFAYAAGRTFGKRLLAPVISPNKTVEGALGGLLGSVACAALYGQAFLPAIPAWYAAAAGLAVGITGQAGDLFESVLKRAAGVKDSGTLFPGHGGVLDRADAILAAGPPLYLLAAMSPLAA
ncbi:MAG TPA: phosphatidate cytidylyltransferase [Candidatus Deferrimicrobiaceae bacterium]